MSTSVKLNLTVSIDINSGFCFGVVYAVQIAEEILSKENKLFCLGDIVHNDEEIARLSKKGLMVISHSKLSEIKNEKVLIRAHGEPPSTYQIAIENNLTLIDASCPVVLKLQNRIKQSADTGKKIFIYGKRGHAEVEGLIGQINGEAVVFSSLEELNPDTIPETISLYSQTTKSSEKFYAIYHALLSKGINVELNDTTCRQVSNRDQQLKTYAESYEVIIFVAGEKSSNGKVLFEVCKSVNRRSYFITKASEIKPEWFLECQTVGICGATSTPMWLMLEVKEELEKL